MSMTTEENTPTNQTSASETKASGGISRRGFVGGGASLLAAIGTVGAASVAAPKPAAAADIGPLTVAQRRRQAYRARVQAARNLALEPLGQQPCNGDETLYADRRASFFKTLPQNDLGEVDESAYQAMLTAFGSAQQADFDAIPLSGEAERFLANPMAAFSLEMSGGDGHSSRIPAAPAFDSAFQASEMAEVYWQAITRDIAFRNYDSDGVVGAAISDLNNFSEIVGPTEGGVITAGTLFRGETPGDRIGPYLSQFLWLEVPYGPSRIEQRYSRPVDGDDFMTSYSEWLAIQRGANPVTGITFDPQTRYLYDGRGLGEWVHSDFSFQAYFNAALILLSFGGEALSDRNPYKTSTNQGAFVTFGGPQILDLVARAAEVSLRTAWYQKWLVHRRLRPEVLAARLENQRTGAKDYGINAELINSSAVSTVLSANGNVLLPQAFPEGSPTHPSYPAGHATIAGACCTVLKAFFKEDFVMPAPVNATDDGLALDAWGGDDLLVGNEINKLAANVSLGRDIAGVHYRTDGIDGITAGEQVAIGLLRDYSLTFREEADGFELTRFDGQKILIDRGEVTEI